MPEHYEPDTGSKSKTYQSIAVYDGSDPAYFKNWHAKVLSHYATWLNGDLQLGIVVGIDMCDGLRHLTLTLSVVLHQPLSYGKVEYFFSEMYALYIELG